MSEKRTYNFNPSGKTFVSYDANHYGDECIDVTIIDCDSEMKEYSMTVEHAKELALVLLQVVDVAANHKLKKDVEDDDE